MKVIDTDRLIRARKRQDYSQRDLAALCDCTQATISALERGEMTGCSEPLARAIARRLDRDVEELFTRHEHTRVQRVTNGRGVTRHRIDDKVPA